jgi:hypothetical protein
MDDQKKMHKNIKYTLEKEQNLTLNYLHLKLQRQKEKFTTVMHHKSAQTIP